MSRRFASAVKAQRLGENDASDNRLYRNQSRFKSQWRRLAQRCADDVEVPPSARSVLALIDSVSSTLTKATRPANPQPLSTDTLCEGANVMVDEAGQCVATLAKGALPRTGTRAGKRQIFEEEQSAAPDRQARRCAALELTAARRYASCEFRVVSGSGLASEAASERCERRFERRWQGRRARVCSEPEVRSGPQVQAIQMLLFITVHTLAELGNSEDDSLPTAVCSGPEVVVSDSGTCEPSPGFTRGANGFPGDGGGFAFRI